MNEDKSLFEYRPLISHRRPKNQITREEYIRANIDAYKPLSERQRTAAPHNGERR
jgi:hypothetical protein